MAKKVTRLTGDQIYLRPLQLKHATEEYLSWLNDSSTNQYLRTQQETMTGLKKYLQERIDRDDIFFAGIFDQVNDRHIGNVQLEIDEAKKNGGMGIMIGNPAYRGKGIGTEVTRLVVRYAFNDRGLEEVWLKVKAKNLAGRRAYEKAGFKVIAEDSDYVTMTIGKDELK